MKRILFLSCGCFLVALGVIGAFVPLMPSSIFFLGAVWCFARSSPRLEAWVLNHPRFGPPLRQWIENRAISRRIKIVAATAMTAGFAIFVVTVHPSALIAVAVALFFIACATWIWTRAEPPT